MGVARSGVSDANEDGQFAFVPVFLQRTHGRVEAQLVIDRNNLIFGNR